MFKVKILTLGKNKENWLSSAIIEYEKRLSSQVHFSWFFAKNEKAFISLCQKESFLITLDPNGEHVDSLAFSDKIFSFLHNHSHLTFIIGGDEGIPNEVKKLSKKSLSLSKLTFTHQMTRLIFIEQFYRAVKIQEKSPYHK